jgi:hypothetical protein
MYTHEEIKEKFILNDEKWDDSVELSPTIEETYRFEYNSGLDYTTKEFVLDDSDLWRVVSEFVLFLKGVGFTESAINDYIDMDNF